MEVVEAGINMEKFPAFLQQVILPEDSPINAIFTAFLRFVDHTLYLTFLLVH